MKRQMLMRIPGWSWGIAIAFLSLLSLPALAGQAKSIPPAKSAPATAQTGTAPPEAKTAAPEKTATTPAPKFTPEQAAINQRIVDTLRAAYNVPPTIDMSVVGREPSKVQGLDTVTVEIKDNVNSNRQEVYVSLDNKFALAARVFDLSVDPFAVNISKINMTNVPVRGNKDARVTLVEYSDFECPFCSQAYRTIENDVMKQYGDKIKMVYKNFPLPSHPWAESAAVAGLCAFRQNNDAFWVFYKSFFENQASITPDNFKTKALEYAAKANIDAKKFDDCYTNKLTLPQVKADMAEAQSLGITGTPLFFVDGHPLSGVQPFSSFQKVIQDELKKPSN